MDNFILNNQFTPKVLEIIAKVEDGIDWYGLELKMGRLKGYGEIPAYYIAKELLKFGYVKEFPPLKGYKHPRYKITQAGLNFLEECESKETS